MKEALPVVRTRAEGAPGGQETPLVRAFDKQCVAEECGLTMSPPYVRIVPHNGDKEV